MAFVGKGGDAEMETMGNACGATSLMCGQFVEEQLWKRIVIV